MDLHRDVQAIREAVGITGHEQDGLIHRRIAYHLTMRGWDPEGNLAVIPHGIEAEIVAAVSHEFMLGEHHIIRGIP